LGDFLLNNSKALTEVIENPNIPEVTKAPTGILVGRARIEHETIPEEEEY
jgi:hypothetical protein